MIFQGWDQPRQDFGARHQFVYDPGMDGMGGGLGRMFMRGFRPGNQPMNGGINPGGMHTGGNLPPTQLQGWQTGGPGQATPFQGWQMGGNTPPMRTSGYGLAGMYGGWR